jgi:hypothetical protein
MSEKGSPKSTKINPILLDKRMKTMSMKSLIRNPKKHAKYNPDDEVDISELVPEIGPVSAQDIPTEPIPVKLVSLSRRILFI